MIFAITLLQLWVVNARILFGALAAAGQEYGL